MKNNLFRAATIFAAVLFLFADTGPVLVHADAPVNNWVRVIAPGFGSSTNMAIYAMEEFEGRLYAGTMNYSNGAEIWRSGDGHTWTNIMKGGFHSSRRHYAITDFVVFDGSLYAATVCSIIHNFCDDAEIWRSADGLVWTEVAFPPGNPVEIVPAMVVYQDALYISLGTRIYKMNHTFPETWTLSKEFLDGTSISAMIVYKDHLYAGGSNLMGTFTAPARIYRYAPSTGWNIVNEPNGENVFSSDDSYEIGDFGVFQDMLFVGLRNANTGGQIWRSSDGTSWAPVMTNGFGDKNNSIIRGLIQRGTQFFALTGNLIDGMQVWQYENGTFWRQINKSGFGQSANISENGGKPIAIFQGNLYIGTKFAAVGSAGQIWMLLGKNISIPYMVVREN